MRPFGAFRLAQGLAGGVADPGFEALLSRIDESAFHAGNRVALFFRGEEAFAAMLADVAEARSEVFLESYIFKDDGTGKRFQRELIGAAARGVTVRVLADAFGSLETPSTFWGELRRHGVEARLFHPLYALKFLSFRDHRKILVVDRRIAYTGGMNIGDEYGSSLLPREKLFRDTHARVEGPAAAEMAVVFREGWTRSGGSAFALEPLPPSEAAGARVLVLDSRPGRGAREAAAVLAAIVGASRRRLWLTVAYFAPRLRAIRILGAAARSGVDVRLLVPAKSDVRIVRHSGHGFYAPLLRSGVRVFEYRPAILHAKTIVADGRVSVVGSSNLDFRSFERNAECNFVIVHAPTASRVEEQFEEDLGQSVEIRLEAWRGRPWPHRLGDALARRLAPLL